MCDPIITTSNTAIAATMMITAGQKKSFFRAGRSFRMAAKVPASSGEMIIAMMNQPNPLRLRRTLANIPTAMENATQKKKNAISTFLQTSGGATRPGRDKSRRLAIRDPEGLGGRCLMKW